MRKPSITVAVVEGLRYLADAGEKALKRDCKAEGIEDPINGFRNVVVAIAWCREIEKWFAVGRRASLPPADEDAKFRARYAAAHKRAP